MSSGGWRPGGGRPKGSKDKKPRKVRKSKEPTEQDKIRQMIEIGKKARDKTYQEFLIRVRNQDGNQHPLTTSEKRLMVKIGAEIKAEEKPEAPKLPEAGTLDADEYLRQVWNDPSIDHSLRIRAAEIIAKGPEKKGKKDEKADRAKAAGSGKFKASAPPVLKVISK